MSNTSKGLGSILLVGATNIGTITKVNAPDLKRDAIDVTVLSSPYGFKQFIAGLADPGLFQIEGFFDTTDAGQNLMYNKFINGTVDTYTLTFPAIVGASWTANCFVKELSMGDEVDTTKAIAFKATLQVTGQPNIGTTATQGLTGLALTGASGTLQPTFATAVLPYAWEFITTTSITITPTAGTQQQYTMYVDGVNQGTFNTGSVSPAIAFAAIGAHKIDLVVSQAGYTPITYSVIAVRTA